MKIGIFVEDSSTTKEETNLSFEEFYQGGFLTISSLADQLDEYGDVELHIMSDQFGIVRGHDVVDEYLGQDLNREWDEKGALSTLLESAANSDVMVILLSASRFNSIVVDSWEQIADNAKPNSIWCLGAARRSLEGIDFDPLRRKECEVVTYERVGVARISNDVREELLDKLQYT